MSKKLLICLVPLVAGAYVTTGTEASAHAMLKRALPGVGSTVATPPHAIELDFSEGVVPSFCGVTMRDDAGRPVRMGWPGKGGEGTTLIAPIAGSLKPGTYTVTWHAVSVDTHRTQGSFSFTVQ